MPRPTSATIHTDALRHNLALTDAGVLAGLPLLGAIPRYPTRAARCSRRRSSGFSISASMPLE